ncbi:MAG: non-homologous end-joining DNA ligase [Terriglobales bacterium]
MSLSDYRRKRRFATTPEPAADADAGPPPPRPRLVRAPRRRRFCVQQHAASHLHYDLRLEMGGVLKSWAVPKGPTLDPEVRRLAMQTEDHPLEYLRFEGEIPTGNYGAGTVVVWDIGEYEIAGPDPSLRQWEHGSVKFILHGRRLRGEFALAKMHIAGGKGTEWLLIKKHDRFARLGDVAEQHPGSVLSRRKPAIRPPRPQAAQPRQRAAGRAESGDVARARRSAAARPASSLDLPGARPGPMPQGLRPMLAVLASQPFSDPDWLYEVKWDGVRALAYCQHGTARLVSRNGRDITAQYPELAALGTAWKAAPTAPAAAVVDGEIVALDERGRSSFSRLQRRMNLVAASEISRARQRYPAVFYAFDLLYYAGAELLQTPLEARKTWLRLHLAADPVARYSDHVAGSGLELLALAQQQRLEGIVAKRRDSVYCQGRSRDWLKFKLEQRQEAVIVGYTDPRGSRDFFGALLLAVYEPGERRFRYIGRVGAGFSAAARKALLAKIRALIRALPPGRPRRPAAIAGLPRLRFHPTPPALVAEVKFLQWTPDGKLRAPAYLGLREDKSPQEAVRE